MKKLLACVLTLMLLFGVFAVSATAFSASYRLVWVVEPSLDYDRVFYCPQVDAFWVDGGMINRLTGQRIPGEFLGGLGGIPMLAFDPQLNAFGVDDHGGLTMSPTGVFPEHFRGGSGFLAVRRIDAVPVSGVFAFAVVYNQSIVTDFIFSGHNIIDGPARNAIAMQRGNLWGTINRRGNVAVPFVFEHIIHIDDNTAFARYNGLYGILDVQSTARANTIFNTGWPSTFWNWLLFFLGFGWIWMWFI